MEEEWPIVFYPLTSGEGSSKRDLTIADFDGDGLKDVVISDTGSAELVYYKQLKKAGLAEPVRFPAFTDVERIVAADIDGDGKSELGVFSVKEKVIGISRFEDERLTFPKPLNIEGEPLAMELQDIDADEKMDCVYISKDENDVRFLGVAYAIGSQQNSKEQQQRLLDIKKLSVNPDGLKVLDVDQDGLEDVLIFVKYESPVLIRQSEQNVFEVVDSPKAQSSLIKEAGLGSIAVADVNEKKGKELLVAQNNFARSLVFAEGKKWTVVDQYNAKSKENKILSVAAFDIEADNSESGFAILLLDGQKGQLQILKRGEDKTFRLEKELDVGKWSDAAHLKMLFEEMEGGGGKEIVLFDSEKFAIISVPEAQTKNQLLERKFSYETKIKDGAYGNFTAGEINSDGRTDVVMVEYKHNHIEILALDSDWNPAAAMRFKIFEEKSYRDRERAKQNIEPREMKIDDVTGDGKKDLVCVIHDRIIIYPQD